MKEFIGPFKLHTKKPNAIKHGFLYELEMELPVPYEKKRMVRVFVPEDYSEDRKYPVIYMSDGQNCVDRYLSAYGEWNIDIKQHSLRKMGYSPFIVVGIDCPKEEHVRTLEYSPKEGEFKGNVKKYCPSGLPTTGYIHLLNKFIVKELKPLIDKTFSTRKEREFTGCGGSSCGGVFSMCLFTEYPEVFGYCLSFSPAYCLFKKTSWMKMMNERIGKIDKNSKVFLYSGNVGFEHEFYKPAVDTYKYLSKKGIKCDLIIDEKGIHHEKCWSKQFVPAMKMWLPKE